MPDWKKEIRRRMAQLKLAPARESEIVEELGQHLDDRYQELLADGASHTDAERLILAELSENEFFSELLRGERNSPSEPIVTGTNRKINILADIWNDLRFGIRMLLKRPGFTAIAVLSLAVISVGLAVTGHAIQTVGGRAAYKEFPVERAFRDLRTATLMPPTMDRMMEAIGKAALGLEAAMFRVGGTPSA